MQTSRFILLLLFLFVVEAVAQPTTPPSKTGLTTPLSGIKTIGPSGDDYATLTDAFADIDLNGLGGAIILELQSDYTSAGETIPLQVSPAGSAANTITIRPAIDATDLVISSNAAAPTISLSGVSYVTIDGRPGGVGNTPALSIQNSWLSATAVLIEEGSNSCTIEYCELFVSASIGSGTVVAVSAQNEGTANILISDCIVREILSDAPPYVGIELSSSLSAQNFNTTIRRCFIVNCTIGVFTQSNTINTTIEDNSIFHTPPIMTGTGTMGIEIGDSPQTVIRRNKIYNLAIHEDNSLVEVIGIVISGQGFVDGESVGGPRGPRLRGNSRRPALPPSSKAGISSRITIENNFIALDGAAEMDSALLYGIAYVNVPSVDENHIQFNTIFIGGSNAADGESVGFYKQDEAHTFTLENNIIVNARSNSTGTGTHYAIKAQPMGIDVLDHNNYFVSGTGGMLGNWDGLDEADLSSWQLASSQDGASVSVNVTFADAPNGDLHLAGGSIGDFNLTGSAIDGVAQDIDGDTRDEFFPYMGADENAGSPLPIQLTSITASAGERSAELHWRTATEVALRGFEIERRPMNQGDNTAWSRVGFVNASGSSSAPHEYSFTNRDLLPGRYAFRLRMINQDGSSHLSGSVEIEIESLPRTLWMSGNYPNPFNPSTTLTFTLPEDGHVTIKIYDVLGKEVGTLINEERKAGVTHQVAFDASHLASGMYFATLQFGQVKLTHKMMYLR